MIILPVHQGTPEWHAARAKYYRTASRAPTVMRENKYQTYEELLREIKFGITKDVDANTQARFDAGHAAEAAMRPIVEKYLKAPLLPLTCLTDDEYLLASYDGIAEAIKAGWEHKLLAAALMAAVRAKSLEPYYYWQCEAQAIVGDLDYVIFTCSDGTKENAAHMKYVPVPGRAEALLAAWRQFDRDLADYQPVEVLPPITAAPVMALPTLFIQARGEVTKTNMPEFKAQITEFLGNLNMKPETDQEFADGKEVAKKLRELAVKIVERKADMLAQTASIGEVAVEIDHLADVINANALQLEKAVKREEDSRKLAIVSGGRTALADHIAALNRRLGKPYMPVIQADFVEAIKGKRLITAMQNAVDTELARAKIEANEVADRISTNLLVMADHAEHSFLFSDLAQLVLKAPDDFVLAIQARIQTHVVAEAKKLDAEREKIRQEETAKAEAAARAKVEAEQREQADAKARQEREEQAVEDKRIAQALADEEARLQADRAQAAKRQQVEFDREAEKVRAQQDAAVPVDPILDRVGLIRSFMAGKKYPAKKMNETVALLHEFCEFLDKFKQERKAA